MRFIDKNGTEIIEGTILCLSPYSNIVAYPSTQLGVNAISVRVDSVMICIGFRRPTLDDQHHELIVLHPVFNLLWLTQAACRQLQVCVSAS